MGVSPQQELQINKTPKVVSVGCKGNVVLCECGKTREMGKMCHIMSIDEKVTCMGGFNLLISELLVVIGRKNRPCIHNLVLQNEPL